MGAWVSIIMSREGQQSAVQPTMCVHVCVSVLACVNRLLTMLWSYWWGCPCSERTWRPRFFPPYMMAWSRAWAAAGAQRRPSSQPAGGGGSGGERARTQRSPQEGRPALVQRPLDRRSARGEREGGGRQNAPLGYMVLLICKLFLYLIEPHILCSDFQLLAFVCNYR